MREDWYIHPVMASFFQHLPAWKHHPKQQIHVQGHLLMDKPWILEGVVELPITDIAPQYYHRDGFKRPIEYINITNKTCKPFFEAFCG